MQALAALPQLGCTLRRNPIPQEPLDMSQRVAGGWSANLT